MYDVKSPVFWLYIFFMYICRMERKICSKCGEEKGLTEFNKLGRQCKLCIKEYKQKWGKENRGRLKDYRANWYKANKGKLKEKKRIYYEKNIEEIRKYLKTYREENKEKLKEQKSNWYKNNKDKVKVRFNVWYNENKKSIIRQTQIYVKNRCETDLVFKLSKDIRKRISIILNKRGYTKKSRTQEILGCSYDEFRIHIESQFEDWMTWDNRGLYNGEFKYGWDIDHIQPISMGETEEDIIRLNHYTNLRPLCSKVNRDIKRDRIL